MFSGGIAFSIVESDITVLWCEHSCWFTCRLTRKRRSSWSSLALRSIDQNSPKKATESLTFDNTWYSYLFIFNLKYLQRDEDRERGVPFIGSLWLQWPDLNQVEARGWELHLILPCVSAAQILGSFCMLFPGNSCGAGFEVDQLGHELFPLWMLVLEEMALPPHTTTLTPFLFTF